MLAELSNDHMGESCLTMPLAQACLGGCQVALAQLGVDVVTLKRVRRANNMNRWPYHKCKKLGSMIDVHHAPGGPGWWDKTTCSCSLGAGKAEAGHAGVAFLLMLSCGI